MKNEFKRLIKLDQVEALTGFKKSYLYSRIQSGDFPNPVHIGRSARWVESEVLAWVENMIELHRIQEVS
jgi:prophage regulatory protein